MATHHVHTMDQPQAMAEPREGPGLRSPHVLARWPWIGLLLVLIGGIAFGTVTFNVYTHGPLLQWDGPLSVSLPAYSLQHQALFRPLTDAGFFIGGWLLTLLGFLLLVYFSSRRYWEEFFMLLVGMVGESALFEIISHVVNRPRPPTQIWNVLHIPGFPSGHVEASVVFYGFAAYLLVPRARAVILRVLISLLAIAIVAFVGFSRVFTAGHYLSDVLGGFCLGLLWAGIAYTSVELIFRRKRSENDKTGKTYPPEIDR